MSRPLLTLKIVNPPGILSRRPILDVTPYNSYCLGDNLPLETFTIRITTLQELVYNSYPTRCHIMHRTLVFFVLLTASFLLLVVVLVCARSILLAVELLVPEIVVITWILLLRRDSRQRLDEFATRSLDLVNDFNKVDTPSYGVRWMLKRSLEWHPLLFELWQVDLEAADYELPTYQEHPGEGSVGVDLGVVLFEGQPPGYEEFWGSSAVSLERRERRDNEADMGEMVLRQTC